MRKKAKETLTVEAKVENLEKVTTFVNGLLQATGCSMKAQVQIDVAVEEIFVNIAHYAYAHGSGDAVISCEISGDPAEAVIEFRDRGSAFDPLGREDPDITLSAEERRIGGLGIYMVKKSMDGMMYMREDGQNVLTIRKKL